MTSVGLMRTMSSFNNYLILVFGVSGAGKTTACLDYCNSRSDVLYTAASTILRETTGQTSEQLRLSDANVISDNQLLLSNQINAIRSRHHGKLILVDAHGVINNGEQLVPISISTIKNLVPTGLILIEPLPDQIISQRAMSDRPRPIKSVKHITDEIFAERTVVQSYSNTLGIPLYIIQSSTGTLLADAIASIIQTERDGR